MSKEYENILHNIEHKSYKVKVPENMFVNLQNYNDFYGVKKENENIFKDLNIENQM